MPIAHKSDKMIAHKNNNHKSDNFLPTKAIIFFAYVSTFDYNYIFKVLMKRKMTYGFFSEIESP